MADASHVHGAFGLRIGASFPIPALRTATGTPDILITRSVGDGDGARCEQADWGVDGTRVRFDMGGGLRFTVEDGARIHVVAAPATHERDLLTWLTGPVLGAALIQRGMLVVHGNAVVFGGGEAAAMVGEAGAGKSTTVAALQAAGLEPLADDLLAIDFDADGAPIAWPGIPRVKLTRASADALSIDVEKVPFVGAGMHKHEVPLNGNGDWDRPFPLTRLYVLEKGPLGFERLTGQRAGAALLDNLFWLDAQAQLPGEGERFVKAMRLAASADCFAYRRPFDLDRLAESRDALIEHLGRAP